MAGFRNYGMTLQEKHKIDLTQSLMNQLGATEEILQKWETEKYQADGDTVAQFWNYIKPAPAVYIVGDYDVDGICATYTMKASIRENFPDKQVITRIPRRFSEGYGINESIAEEIKATLPKGSVIITVDNGIAAAPILEDLEDNGYVVLMTDHHELREGCQVPNVTMTIDPSVKEIPNPLDGRYWCGAAVAYKLCEPMISEKLAHELSVYAGLATVADCMVLKEGNWGMVRHALKAFREKTAPEALCMLLKGLRQSSVIVNEDAFGFYLGPAFNAPGRLLDNGAARVLEYLDHPTKEGCKEICTLNGDRRQLRDEEYEIVLKEIHDKGMEKDCPIWVAVDGLHEGIVGILAGKVSEEFQVPAIVLTNTEQGFLKGSARAYGEFDIFKYLSSMPDKFLRMGGHPGAAGLSMTRENFEEAKKNQVRMEHGEDGKPGEIVMKIRSFEIPGLNAVLGKFRPFGEGNQIPKFELEVDLGNLRADEVWRTFGKDVNENRHFGIKDKNDRWDAIHFFHYPNTLSNKNHFGMIGTIGSSETDVYSKYGGKYKKEMPVFNAEEAFDIDEENNSRDENIHL